MQNLDLNFTFQNGDSVNVDVESGTILEDAWDQMVNAEVIKPLPADKKLIICNAEGQMLDIKRTMEELGVQSGDTLSIIYQGAA